MKQDRERYILFLRCLTNKNITENDNDVRPNEKL